MTGTESKIIGFRDISVVFPLKGKNIEAVKNISFDIERGEVFGIVGTSGAGKSTLLRTINLLQKPNHGNVYINGKEITGLKGDDLRKLRVEIGMIFQQFNLINTKTVYENVAFAMRVGGKDKEQIKQRVPEVLQLVGLLDRASSYPAKLSGGEKQRVGIARALVNSPQILLCDEPTSSLDLETTNAILELLKEINASFGITIVIISHEMDVIKKVCDRVAVMSKGELLELDNVFNIFTAPKHEFTQCLVNRTMGLDLPIRFFHIEGQKTLKIVYSGEKAEEAVISDTIKFFDVALNILHGKIEYIAGQPYGVLVITIKGNAQNVIEAEKYLKERTYKVEVIYD